MTNPIITILPARVLKMKRSLFVLMSTVLCLSLYAGPVDRRTVVSRHNPVITGTIPDSPAQVGNGHFAFGADITGLQSFNAFNTLSDWGWHSFPLPKGMTPADYRPVVMESYGKSIPYILNNPDTPEISEWLRGNPHRVNLGRLGFILLDSDGNLVDEGGISDARQEIDLWSGLISSSFSVDDSEVKVRTSCHPFMDVIAVSVESELIKEGRLEIFLDLPYASNKSFEKMVGEYDADDNHSSEISFCDEKAATVVHVMDDLTYFISLHWHAGGQFSRCSPEDHRYILTPDGNDRFEITCSFSNDICNSDIGVGEIESASARTWEMYWMSGAAVDFSLSADPRWMELERRVVLSQYLMRLNEAGTLPPQESGLVNNGWYGRFHWEMIWWHGAHFGLWNRMDCIDEYLGTYTEFMPEAISRAESEGRSGARWPKCTGNINQEWPCEPHALLCWQQPHPIWFAEMEYRADPSRTIIEKWRDIVINTADYMADMVFWDKKGKRYVIGPPVIPVSENTGMDAFNPIFELSYFKYGLRTALMWAERLNMPHNRTKKWKDVLQKLSDLPVGDGCYKTHENMEDMWVKFNFEHPALTGVYGWLPGDGVDVEIFRKTFYKVLDEWQMDKVWGWDYPMLAMAAVRLGDYSKAIDLLCTTAHKYGFDPHGLAKTWPFPYFPANGGLLAAVAMMCGGWDGCADAFDMPEGYAPGFPHDGSWTVLCEGFNRMQ